MAKFSRPLLLVTDRKKGENIYQTIYGFVVPDYLGDMAYYKVSDYVGYICGLSCWANGDRDFHITFMPRGVPDWVDREGRIHMKQDSWMQRIGEKCMEKLDLSYEIITGFIDEDIYSRYVNESDLIVNEDLFEELEEPVDEPPCTKEEPLWAELPD